MTDTLTLIRPDDWHIHFRDDAAMASVLPDTARVFGRAIAMPNLKPPVTTVALAAAYRERLLAAVPGGVVGAIPPVIGWVAGGGDPFDPRIASVAFFFFMWQVPHFWLLLIFSCGSDYERAGLPSLTRTFSVAQISRITFMWILGTVMASVLIPLFGLVDDPWVIAGFFAAGGWLEVDKTTLQHRRYPNVFGIGDVNGTPRGKTAATVKKSAPIVAHNLVQAIAGGPPDEAFDGYTSCPLITREGAAMLIEFDYEGRLTPSLPMIEPLQESYFAWLMKYRMLKPAYMAVLKGRV